MAFTDYTTAGELSLRVRVTVRTNEKEWVTGKVVELALLGDAMDEIMVTLDLGEGKAHQFTCKPSDSIIYEW